MKAYAPLLSALLLVSCSHVSTQQETASVSGAERTIASKGKIAKEFLDAAFKSQDNLLYKSASDMEGKLLAEIKANPVKYGLDPADAKGLKSVDDIKNERVMAEILSEAPGILKFTPKMKSAAVAAVMDNAGVAAHIKLKSVEVTQVKLELHEQTAFGRTTSLRIKNLKNNIVSRGLASEAEATKIVKDLHRAAEDMARNAKGNPAEMLAARQIIDFSTAISEKTGKPFLGAGGCAKINGKTVLDNMSESAYRTMKEVDAKGLKSYDEISEALQKHHGDVTNRTKREACMAIDALTRGQPCGDVYSRKLAPKGC